MRIITAITTMLIDNTKQGKKGPDSPMFEIIIVPVLSIGVALLIKRYIFFITQVLSHSMRPTLQPNQRLFTLRVSRPNQLKRGDIIVFYSREKKIRMIKRLIGLPGDTVQIKEDGSLLLNGKEAKESYVENQGGKSGTFLVPADTYFFLGDNRSGSGDSRHWSNAGIPAEDIQGKVIFSLYPFRKI